MYYDNPYKNLRFGLYARKSEEDKKRQIQSIESQVDVLIDCAEREGINIVRRYEDCASAHKPNNRANFSQMLQDINDKKIDAILCWKADRLARNHIEGGMVMHCLEKSIIKMIKTPYKTFLPTDNNLPLTIEFGMANQYSRDLSVNIKRGNQTKVKNGGWCHVAPYGYINNRLEKTIEKDPERFDMIRKMWDLLLTREYSMKKICDIANNEWGYRSRKNRPMTTGSIHALFNKPFYYGYIKSGINTGWGNHEPMITYEEYLKAQEIMNAKARKAHTNDKEYTFSGIMRCGECDAAITAETKVKYKCPKCNKRQTAKHPKKCSCGYEITYQDVAKGKFYTYYLCSNGKTPCSQKTSRKEDIETQFETIIKQMTINSSFVVWAKKWLEFTASYAKKAQLEVRKRKEKQKTALEMQRSNLIDMRMKNEIDGILFKEKKEQLENEIRHIESQLKAKGNTTKTINESIDFLNGLQSRYKIAPSKSKKHILLKLLSNPTLMDRKVHGKAKKIYTELQSFSIHQKNGIEPPLSLSTKDLKAHQKDLFGRWCYISSLTETM